MAEIDTVAMYREYVRPVYCYLLRLCKNPTVAEDLTSETFYQAVKSIKRYDETCKLQTWLFQIAKHIWYREAARRKAEAVDQEVLENVPSLDLIEEQLEETDQKIDLYKRIQALDEPYRSVVYLRLASGMSFDEIGQVLEKNGNWVRVSYYRAKERLKEIGK